MELQQSWELVDFYLAHIVFMTKDLRQKVTKSKAISETPVSGTCVLDEIDMAANELAEALRLSKSANQRLQNLYSHRRGVHDG